MKKLTIDYREHTIFPYLSSIDYGKENLILGDYLIRYAVEGDISKDICIERKTWKDLWSSICDGRFREQRSRLFQWKDDHHRVIYLIEGTPDENLEICQKSIHRLMLVYQFTVWFSQNAADSARYIQWLCKQETLFNESSPIDVQISELSQSMVKKKKDIQTAESYLVAFLQSIHGISYKTASQLVEAPINDLKTFIETYSGVEGLSLLSNRQIVAQSGKTKALGKDRAKRILDMMGIQNCA